MPVNVSAALQQALRQLEGEKSRVERQIQAVRSAIDGVGGGRRAPMARASARRRRRMSPEARRAASQRMKAYWAKRRTATANGKAARKK
jgi:hypothetical protein